MVYSDASDVRMGTVTGRSVIAAAVLGSGMAFLDGTVVNVALKTIGTDLGASFAELQWVTNGYLLSLASLILLGGSLGDRFGRRKVFVIGVVWFAAASALCGLAPTPEVLIAARVLQGVGGALLTPGSLAMIQGAFVQEDRAPAIGAWSGLGGIAAAVGPFVGGTLIDYANWRLIFLINVPLAVVTVLVAVRYVPETRDPHASSHFDWWGAVLASLALAGTTYALIEWGGLASVIAAAVAVLSAAAFLIVESREQEPMLQLGLFGSRTFSASNAMTFLVYGALGAMSFFVTLELQTVLGYGALAAGLAFMPMTVAMLFLASAGGRLAMRIGPRLPMTVGPIVMGAATLVLMRVDADSGYWLDIFPGMALFGLGLCLMVAPLTATVLAAAPDEHAGIASGVNNAVARSGTLIAVAALPVAVGLGGGEYDDAAVFDPAYGNAMLVCALLLGAGGALSWLLIRNTVLESTSTLAEEEAGEG
jgi:EmrB/QacA subfamily drug resistance transporter